MTVFPNVDPIPLPAPIWLFKSLHILTLTGHFLAVHCVVGGLAIGAVWAIAARARNNPVLADASGLVAHRLPVVMAYVINLAVPPLLFAQVLYGRALYTSSILIGAFWISVIFLVIAAYYILYMSAKRAELGRSWGWLGLIALLLLAVVAKIYVSNMTLMLRPEVWPEMYRSNPYGAQLPSGDPTILPRWLYMMAASVAVSGAALSLYSMKNDLGAGAVTLLRRQGAGSAGLSTILVLCLGLWVFKAQPDAVQAALWDSSFHKSAAVLWLVSGHAIMILGARGAFRPAKTRQSLPIWLAVSAVVNTAGMVVVRDGIRDMTLAAKGFDVWDRHVVTNWPVIAVFVVLLVLGLVFVAWMVRVLAKAEGARGTLYR